MVLNAEKHYRSLQLFKDPWVLKVLDPPSNCGHLLVDTVEADVTFSVGKGKSIQKFPAQWFVLRSRAGMRTSEACSTRRVAMAQMGKLYRWMESLQEH